MPERAVCEAPQVVLIKPGAWAHVNVGNVQGPGSSRTSRSSSTASWGSQWQRHPQHWSNERSRATI